MHIPRSLPFSVADVFRQTCPCDLRSGQSGSLASTCLCVSTNTRITHPKHFTVFHAPAEVPDICDREFCISLSYLHLVGQSPKTADSRTTNKSVHQSPSSFPRQSTQPAPNTYNSPVSKTPQSHYRCIRRRKNRQTVASVCAPTCGEELFHSLPLPCALETDLWAEETFLGLPLDLFWSNSRICRVVQVWRLYPKSPNKLTRSQNLGFR